jgi:2-C-methyl-D-erythritol 4-phosphate cytidylyltransferase
MNRNVIAIVTAAGSGTRFSRHSKKETPKQFLRLINKPVILFPLLAMQKCKAISGIFITSAPEYFDYLHSLAVKNKITKLAGLVEGGSTRFESVKNAFEQIDAAGSPLVMIHDAARPNINKTLMEKIIGAANKYGEVIIGSRLSETIKREKNGYISETLNRENLWAIQTPQIFRYKTLKDSYRKTRKNDFTDEASLVEAAGYKVKIIEGTRGNIKITTPEDLDFLKKIMK